MMDNPMWRRFIVGWIFLAGAFLLFPESVQTGPEIPSLSPPEALEMTQAAGTYLVDVRSVAEYCLIGHPLNAVNIPLTFWNEKTHSFEPNDNFIKDLQDRFKTTDILVFICRSGGRSLTAAEEAFRAGYSKVYSVSEGFEGEKDKNGLRTLGGWKNRGLPYTYEINPNLVYHFR